jgi:hypothetical protein
MGTSLHLYKHWMMEERDAKLNAVKPQTYSYIV